MLRTVRTAAIAREALAAPRVPYAAHVSESVVRTAAGDYVMAFRLAGVGFECRDDVSLNAMHERLNVLWRSLASPHLSIWTHLVRRRGAVGAESQANAMPARSATSSAHESAFADDLEAGYRRQFAPERLLSNEIYLSLVFRPANVVSGHLQTLFARRRPATGLVDQRDALDACAKLGQEVRASLTAYEPVMLGTYRHGTIWCSSLLEYFGLLANGEWRRIPLPRSPIADALVGTRLLFGHETIEYRMPGETRVAAMLGIKEYPTPCFIGLFDRLLSAPFPLVATQSFAFLSKATAQSLLQRQFNRMANAGDFAVSQAAELKDALDALTSNEFVMGDHHFTLQVLAEMRQAGESSRGEDRLKDLNDRVAVARNLLADSGMLVAREDLALEAAYWAQMPGNFTFRPRKAPITSRNFAAMAPFHNYPGGHPTGNHWGDALTVLVTAARTPYHFSLHASDPADPHGGNRRDTGHTLICGPTGSGKTVLIGFLVTMLLKRGATQVIFDKDRGLEILVRALGGEYLPLTNREPTGFNPLQLPVTPANVEFLKLWLRALVSGVHSTGGELSARDESDLDRALCGTLTLERPMRRLSRLIEFLDPTDPHGVHARLARWSMAADGDYGWVFDNLHDTLAPRLDGRSVIGFDVTEFLGNDVVRAPVTLYLFHLVRSMLDGRRFVCWMDEFWRLVTDPAFEDFAKDAPKTWRKLNAVMCLATQSASDVLASPISRTLVEQTPTKIFFANVDADQAEYTEGFGLSEREYLVIKRRLGSGSRGFLVKQSQRAVVCELDLSSFEGPLEVISGRRAAIDRMHALMSMRGERPSDWLPEFLQSGRNATRRTS